LTRKSLQIISSRTHSEYLLHMTCDLPRERSQEDSGAAIHAAPLFTSIFILSRAKVRPQKNPGPSHQRRSGMSTRRTGYDCSTPRVMSYQKMSRRMMIGMGTPKSQSSTERIKILLIFRGSELALRDACNSSRLRSSQVA